MITKSATGIENNGSITEIVFHATLSLDKGQYSCVPYEVKASIMP